MKYLPVVLLAGCSMFPTAPEEVNVVVAIPCVSTIPPHPVLQFDAETRGLDYQVRALLLDNTELKKYALDLEAIVDGCR